MKLHEQGEALRKDIARIDELWVEGLSRFGGPFLGGASFTAVDAFFAPIHFRIQTYGLSLSAQAAGYSRMMLELEPMRLWYEQGLKEDFRDPEHDDVVTKFGDILQDLRAKSA